MRKLALLAISFVVLAAAAAPLPFPKPGDLALKALHGEWHHVRTTFEGKYADVGGGTLLFRGGKMTYVTDGEEKTAWSFTIAAMKTPHEMTLEGVRGTSDRLLA